jgi:hypothetical protein
VTMLHAYIVSTDVWIIAQLIIIQLRLATMVVVLTAFMVAWTMPPPTMIQLQLVIMGLVPIA